MFPGVAINEFPGCEHDFRLSYPQGETKTVNGDEVEYTVCIEQRFDKVVYIEQEKELTLES